MKVLLMLHNVLSTTTMLTNNTQTIYNSTGTYVYDIGFDYSNPLEVHVSVADEDGKEVDIYNWEFLGYGKIRFTSEPPEIFTISRQTDISNSYGNPRFSTFNTGSMLNASDLNGNLELLRRAIEENRNDLLGNDGLIDPRYVAVVGDHMTGPLTLGPDDSTFNITLSTAGTGAFTGAVTSAATTSGSTDTTVTTKGYVDGAISSAISDVTNTLGNYVLKVGDDMTGSLTFKDAGNNSNITLNTTGVAEFKGLVKCLREPVDGGSYIMTGQNTTAGNMYVVRDGTNTAILLRTKDSSNDNVKISSSGDASFIGSGSFVSDTGRIESYSYSAPDPINPEASITKKGSKGIFNIVDLSVPTDYKFDTSTWQAFGVNNSDGDLVAKIKGDGVALFNYVVTTVSTTASSSAKTLTTKDYVDSVAGGGGSGDFVKKVGDTMSGALYMQSNNDDIPNAIAKITPEGQIVTGGPYGFFIGFKNGTDTSAGNYWATYPLDDSTLAIQRQSSGAGGGKYIELSTQDDDPKQIQAVRLMDGTSAKITLTTSGDGNFQGDIVCNQTGKSIYGRVIQASEFLWARNQGGTGLYIDNTQGSVSNNAAFQIRQDPVNANTISMYGSYDGALTLGEVGNATRSLGSLTVFCKLKSRPTLVLAENNNLLYSDIAIEGNAAYRASRQSHYISGAGSDNYHAWWTGEEPGYLEGKKDCTERMRLSNIGHLGIGTNDPSSGRVVIAKAQPTDGIVALDLEPYNANVNTTTDLRLSLNGVIGAQTSINFACAGLFRWYAGATSNTGTAGATEIWRLSSDGKLGIRNNNADHWVDIGNSGTTDFILGSSVGSKIQHIKTRTNSTNHADQLRIFAYRAEAIANWNGCNQMIQRRVDSADLGFISFGNASDAISFGYNDTKHVTINSNGSLGINTLPSVKLHVTNYGITSMAEVARFTNIVSGVARGIEIICGSAAGADGNNFSGFRMHNTDIDFAIRNQDDGDMIRISKAGLVTFTQDATINGIVVGRGGYPGGQLSTNTVVGYNSLNANTTGNRCTAVGYNSLSKNTTGFRNTAIGHEALINNTFGKYNTATGQGTLLTNVSGNNNTANGYSALWINNTGNDNTAIGASALQGNTDGSGNTATGYNALYSNNGGSFNSAMGYEAGRYRQDGGNASVFDNCSYVGYNSRASATNQVQLGDSNTTTYTYGATQNRSDARDKTDIRDTLLGLDFIKSLRPVDFRWDIRDDYLDKQEITLKDGTTEERLVPVTKDGSRARSRFHHGLIAQEVKAAADEQGVDFAGYQDHSVNGGCDVLSIGYTELIAPLIKAVQELSAENADLKARITALEEMNDEKESN